MSQDKDRNKKNGGNRKKGEHFRIFRGDAARHGISYDLAPTTQYVRTGGPKRAEARTKRNIAHQLVLAARKVTPRRDYLRFTQHRLDYQVAAEHIYPLK